MSEIKVERLRRFEGKGNLKAFVDISFDSGFVIKGLRIVEGKKGLFLGMPRQAGKDGQWYNIAYPTTKEMRQRLSEIILSAYNE